MSARLFNQRDTRKRQEEWRRSDQTTENNFNINRRKPYHKTEQSLISTEWPMSSIELLKAIEKPIKMNSKNHLNLSIKKRHHK